MGGNPYRFWIIYIDFEIFLITCFEFFFCSSHDLLGIAGLVCDQVNPFCNCYSMLMQNQMAQVRRNKVQDNSTNSQERAT